MAGVRVTKTSKIPKLIAGARALTIAAVDKTAHDIEATAKDIAPYDTGATKASIQVTDTGEFSRQVSAGTDYSEFLEYGTTRMVARPFMTPAAEQHKPAFEQAMSQIIR